MAACPEQLFHQLVELCRRQDEVAQVDAARAAVGVVHRLAHARAVLEHGDVHTVQVRHPEPRALGRVRGHQRARLHGRVRRQQLHLEIARLQRRAKRVEIFIAGNRIRHYAQQRPVRAIVAARAHGGGAAGGYLESRERVGLRGPVHGRHGW